MDRSPIDFYHSGVERIDAEDGSGHLGAPGTDKAGKADDLAAPYLEPDAGEHTTSRQPLHAQRHLPDGDFLFGEEGIEGTAHHHLDQLIPIDLLDRAGSDQLAIAKDRDAIRDGK